MTEASRFPHWKDLLDKESARVDWKAGGDPHRIAKTLCAFANDYQGVGGGYVICGVLETVDESGAQKANPQGLTAQERKSIRDKVFQCCKGFTKPAIGPAVEEFPLEETGKSLLIFFQERSRSAHQFKEQGQFIYPIRIADRVTNANGQIPKLLERKGQLPAFLEQPNPDASVADMDLVALENDLKLLNFSGQPSDYLSPETWFGFGIPPLIQEVNQTVKPLNLALLLFGRMPQRFIPGARVIFSRYDGYDRTAEDNQSVELTGPLSVLISQTMRRLNSHMVMITDKKQPTGRQNRVRYSNRAVSEAVVNALVHRDYSVPHPVRITLFKDRLEVSSPGGLPWDVSETAFKQGQAGAKWRNDKLAVYMLYQGMAQYQGQGIPTIIEETRRVSGKDARFVLEPENTTVVIPAYQGNGRTQTAKPGQRPGLLLISIGGPSIEEQVEASLPDLGLEDAETAVNFIYPHFLPNGGPEWDRELERLKKELSAVVDRHDYSDFHLFLRGPLVVGTLVGAIFGATRTLYVYGYDEGRYVRSLRIDKRYLKT